LPRRIVCLSEEPTEILYHLGESGRIVGVTAYTVRPPEARRKAVVSRFIEADIPAILDLEPDLVFTFSDLQAEIAAELIRAGVQVHAFNQRSVGDILAAVRTVGALVGRQRGAERYAAELSEGLAAVRHRAAALP
jgi:iron complex transport system substrate-binding protein